MFDVDEVMGKRYYVRNHNTFTSGNGLSSPANGSTNIYREDQDGNPIFNFDIIDQIYDNYLEKNFIPIVELGFMPLDLVEHAKDIISDWQVGRDVGREVYEISKWKSPPKDYQKWRILVKTFVEHLYERYGDDVQNWYFELWNEPDLSNYWSGSCQEYCQLYDYSVDAIKSVNQHFRIGGPATSAHRHEFLKQFLEHVTNGTNYLTKHTGTHLDFISFHTKGLSFSLLILSIGIGKNQCFC